MATAAVTDISLLEAALDYAGRGLPVFPCDPGTKRPLVEHGLHDASTDDAAIEQWWRKWPDAMIGMPTGAATGVWALDVDDPALFQECCEIELPPTRRCVTGKGYHLYFRFDPAEPVRNRQRHPKTGWPFSELPGAETRGEGGYTILPPSRHPSGRLYQWVDDSQPALAPAALLDIVLPVEQPQPETPSRAERHDFHSRLHGDDTPYGLKALAEECGAIRRAANGEQECALNEAALKIGALVAGGELSVKTARAELIAAGMAMPSYNSRDRWTLDMITEKVKRGMDDGAARPRSAPRDRAFANGGERVTSHDEGDQFRAEASPTLIVAKPFVWRAESEIAPRRFLYGRHLIRKFLSVDIAAGGLGKSSVKIVEALAMTTGRTLLHKAVHDGPLRVWLYNLEDPDEETERRIHAAAKHYQISPEDVGDRLFVNSGRDQPVVIAEETSNGARIVRPVVDAIIAQLRERQIDVLTLDPFVSSHSITENDNGAIDMVAKEWSRIADVCDCSINLVHHIRKQNGAEVTAESSRGAISLIGAARSVVVYNRMTKDEAERAGIDQHQAGFYFRMQSDKANLAPPDAADWHRMNNVDLDNGDKVGVACPWQWPDPFSDVTTHHLRAVQAKIAEGRWRESNQAADWAGKVVAEVLDLDLENKPSRRKVIDILKTWISNGALSIEEGLDGHRETKKFIVVGSPA